MDNSTTSNNPPDPLDCNGFQFPPTVPPPPASLHGFQVDQTIYQHQHQHQRQVDQPNVYLYPNISMENVGGLDRQYYYDNNVTTQPLNNQIMGESEARMQQQQERQLEKLQRQIEQLQKLQKEQHQLRSSGTSFPPLFPMTQPNPSMHITLQFSPYTQDFSLFPSLVHLVCQDFSLGGYVFLLISQLHAGI